MYVCIYASVNITVTEKRATPIFSKCVTDYIKQVHTHQRFLAIEIVATFLMLHSVMKTIIPNDLLLQSFAKNHALRYSQKGAKQMNRLSRKVELYVFFIEKFLICQLSK